MQELRIRDDTMRHIARLALATLLLTVFADTVQAADTRDYYTRPINFNFHFKDTYSPADIRAYELALKRKDFAAVIQWQPLLVVAADNGDVRSVRWMLENGIRATLADQTGRDALFHLGSPDADRVNGNRAEIARLLIAHGANPNRFATGTSVVYALTAGNRDVGVLKVVLDAGGDANGNARDVYPPICTAGTPAFIDALHAAGARLEFPERPDFRNVAECLSLTDMDKKERKTVLRHLKDNYGIAPGSTPTGAAAAASTVATEPPSVPMAQGMPVAADGTALAEASGMTAAR